MLSPLTEHEEATLPDGKPNPRHRTEAGQKEAIVSRALGGLKPDKRAAIALRYFEGMTYQEIAQVMSRPEGTVKSLVFRALEELRGRMARFDADELLGELS